MRDINLNPYESEIAPEKNNYTANDEDTIAKTGTTTIGITTTDGVVIATDRRASLGGKFVSSKDIVKVEQIQPQTGMTLVGSVGGAQDFIKQMRAEASLYEARRREQMSVSSIASVARGLARRGPFRAINPIIGGVDDTGSHVFTIDPAGGCIEDKYAVTGSGMMVAHGKLEDEYYDEITNEEARALAGKAIKAAAERDAGSGNGLVLCTITEDNLQIEKYDDYSIVDEL